MLNFMLLFFRPNNKLHKYKNFDGQGKLKSYFPHFTLISQKCQKT